MGRPSDHPPSTFLFDMCEWACFFTCRPQQLGQINLPFARTGITAPKEHMERGDWNTPSKVYSILTRSLLHGAAIPQCTEFSSMRVQLKKLDHCLLTNYYTHLMTVVVSLQFGSMDCPTRACIRTAARSRTSSNLPILAHTHHK